MTQGDLGSGLLGRQLGCPRLSHRRQQVNGITELGSSLYLYPSYNVFKGTKSRENLCANVIAARLQYVILRTAILL